MSRADPPEVAVTVAEDETYRHETWRFVGSDGDPVMAEAWLSRRAGPVIIVGHGARSSRKAPYIQGAAKSWARRGFSVLAADAPMHGDRATGASPPPMGDVHRSAFVEQAAGDVLRLADAAGHRLGSELPFGYLGFSMGVQYGVPAVASDARFRAAILAVGGSTRAAIPEIFGDVAEEFAERVSRTDPVRRAPEISPRPVLMVNADRDEMFSRASALALYDALRPPKEISFFPGSHAVWRSPAQWYRRMEHFFVDHLVP